MKKIAILQSNYIPWKGVFDMINMVDVFVFLDDADYTKRDWRSRNKIKTVDGDQWLTVPVNKKPRGTKIEDIQINNSVWQKKHLTKIEISYQNSPYFKEYYWLLEEIYSNKLWVNLSEMNQFVTKLISQTLSIDTKFVNSSDINVKGSKDDKLINICKHLNAKAYLSGPAAKDYIKVENFEEENIVLEYINYDYPEYDQLYGKFNHYVTVLDVLFHCGEKAGDYIFKGQSNIATNPKKIIVL